MSSKNLPPICEPRPMGWWERNMVPRLIGCCCAQPQVMKARSLVVPQAQGDVLELGCGGGINLGFYDMNRVKSLTGLDPSPACSTKHAIRSKPRAERLRSTPELARTCPLVTPNLIRSL